jgi:hypothetical protein
LEVRKKKGRIIMIQPFAICTIILFTTEAGTASCQHMVRLADVDSGTTSPTGQYRWMDIANNLYAEGYRNSYNYTQANVNIYYTTDANMLYGTLFASNLKPNFAYQVKLAGTSGTASDELIGLTGRWWQEEWNGSAWVNGQNFNDKGDGSSPNPNDTVYFSRKDVNDLTSPTGKHYRFTGYLVFDYFITDVNGDATLAFGADSSYHVLWKTSQRGHTIDDGPITNILFDPDPHSVAYDTDYGISSGDVYGEWERLPVSGVYLPAGAYDAALLLTEESFHSCGTQYGGCWAAAMAGTAHFSIPVCIVGLHKLHILAEEWLMTGNELISDLDASNNVDFYDYSILASHWLDCCPQ